jgi:hypothetical protein
MILKVAACRVLLFPEKFCHLTPHGLLQKRNNAIFVTFLRAITLKQFLLLYSVGL